MKYKQKGYFNNCLCHWMPVNSEWIFEKELTSNLLHLIRKSCTLKMPPFAIAPLIYHSDYFNFHLIHPLIFFISCMLLWSSVMLLCSYLSILSKPLTMIGLENQSFFKSAIKDKYINECVTSSVEWNALLLFQFHSDENFVVLLWLLSSKDRQSFLWNHNKFESLEMANSHKTLVEEISKLERRCRPGELRIPNN